MNQTSCKVTLKGIDDYSAGLVVYKHECEIISSRLMFLVLQIFKNTSVSVTLTDIKYIETIDQN
jgi:hypothetical protein